MKCVEAVPVKAAHSNQVLKGFGDDVADLHVTHVQYTDHTCAVVSVWRVGIWARIKFLFDGRINAALYGKTHAPLSITLGDYGKTYL